MEFTEQFKTECGDKMRKDITLYKSILNFKQSDPTASRVFDIIQNDYKSNYFETAGILHNVIIHSELLNNSFYKYYNTELAKKFRANTPLNDYFREKLNKIYDDCVLLDHSMKVMELRGYGSKMIYEWYLEISKSSNLILLINNQQEGN